MLLEWSLPFDCLTQHPVNLSIWWFKNTSPFKGIGCTFLYYHLSFSICRHFSRAPPLFAITSLAINYIIVARHGWVVVMGQQQVDIQVDRPTDRTQANGVVVSWTAEWTTLVGPITDTPFSRPGNPFRRIPQWYSQFRNTPPTTHHHTGDRIDSMNRDILDSHSIHYAKWNGEKPDRYRDTRHQLNPPMERHSCWLE